MSGVFEHSIKVPRLYKTVAKIVQTVREDGASLKQLVYLKKHPNIKALYALALTCLQHGSQLDQLIRRTKILLNETRLDPWLARILITELLWGKKKLSSECKPVKTILNYEKLLNQELSNIGKLDYCHEKNKKQKINKVDKPRYVRVNTLAMSVEDAISAFEEEGWRPLYRSKNYTEFIKSVLNLSGSNSFIQDIHVPELLIFPPKTQFYNHQAYTSGSIILQDKASCLPAYLLNAKPGSTVLDMCASPGMKTTHLAAMLENKGKIYAVEIDKRRYDTLCEIIESTNSYCVETINADVMTLDDKKLPGVEYILVDPSCSGSGMLDRLEMEFSNNEEKCAPGRLRNLQSFQIIILRHALLNFPTAKRIVYSTCSIYSEENEKVVDEVLSQVGDSYRLISAKNLMKNNWLNYSSTEFNCKDNCLYARPDTDLSNGFFVAVFERNFDIPLPEIRKKKNKLGKKNQEFGTIKAGEDDDEFEEDNEGKKEKKKKRKIVENIVAEDEKLKLKGNDESKEFEKIEEEGSTKNDNNIGVDNYIIEVVTTKRKEKKSKRKYNNDAIVVETAVDENNDDYEKFLDDRNLFGEGKVGDLEKDSLVPPRKKKKCKKSKEEYEENADSSEIINYEEEEEKEFDDSCKGKRRSKKKSKKNKEIDRDGEEIDNNDGIIEENIDETMTKKRKKKKKI